VTSYQKADGQDIYGMLQAELKEIMLVEKSKMLGREYTLGKNTNPLEGSGSLSFSTV